MFLTHKIRFALIALILAMAALVVVSCDSDDDETTLGTLTGNVIFHGEWPSTGTVQLSIFDDWANETTDCWWCAQNAGGPPSYHTESTYFQDPDPSNTNESDTLAFSLGGITLGTYEVVVVGWRNPTPTGNVECDEPVIGMYGAVAGTSDTIPSSVVFAENSATQTIEIHVYFDRRLPVAGCADMSRIEGSITFSGTWPTENVAAIITTMPYTAWEPGGIAGYRGRAEIFENTLYYSFAQPYGTYYVSFWTDNPPPNNLYLGSYGVVTSVMLPPGSHDAASDPVTTSEETPSITLASTALATPVPHYVAGTVTFTGDRPAAGLAVALSPTPVLMGPPAGWYALDATETSYALTGMTDGASLYVLLYENSTSPSAELFGFYDADADGDADPLLFDSSHLGYMGIALSN